MTNEPPTTTPPATPPTAPAKTGGFGCFGCLGIACGLVLLIFVIAMISSAIGGSSGDSPSDSDGLAIVTCERLVKDNLKSPLSAKFSDESVSGGMVTGSVDAENSFGASIRNDFSCSVEGDTVHLVSLNAR